MSAHTKEKKSQGKGQLVETVRKGAIAASIWLRQTPSGYQYLEFSLSRSWKRKDGAKEGYSSNFFDRNEEELLEVISQASEYIRQHPVTNTTSDMAAAA